MGKPVTIILSIYALSALVLLVGCALRWWQTGRALRVQDKAWLRGKP